MGGKQRWREPLIRKMMSNPFIAVLVMYSWVLFNTDLLHTRRWYDATDKKEEETKHLKKRDMQNWGEHMILIINFESGATSVACREFFPAKILIFNQIILQILTVFADM